MNEVYRMNCYTAWEIFWYSVSVGLLIFTLIVLGPERYKEWREERQQKRGRL